MISHLQGLREHRHSWVCLDHQWNVCGDAGQPDGLRGLQVLHPTDRCLPLASQSITLRCKSQIYSSKCRPRRLWKLLSYSTKFSPHSTNSCGNLQVSIGASLLCFVLITVQILFFNSSAGSPCNVVGQCGPQVKCTQKYSVINLISIDGPSVEDTYPNNHHNHLYHHKLPTNVKCPQIKMFRLPTACVCELSAF